MILLCFYFAIIIENAETEFISCSRHGFKMELLQVITAFIPDKASGQKSGKEKCSPRWSGSSSLPISRNVHMTTNMMQKPGPYYRKDRQVPGRSGFSWSGCAICKPQEKTSIQEYLCQAQPVLSRFCRLELLLDYRFNTVSITSFTAILCGPFIACRNNSIRFVFSSLRNKSSVKSEKAIFVLLCWTTLGLLYFQNYLYSNFNNHEASNNQVDFDLLFFSFDSDLTKWTPSKMKLRQIKGLKFCYP